MPGRISHREGARTDSRRGAGPVRSVALVSLGCPKNLVDSERMLGLMAADGLVVTPDAADADAIVINTCGFLEASRTEALEEIRQAVALKRSGKCQRVVVAGCLVQRDKMRLLDEVEGIDRLVGVFDRDRIVEAVRGGADGNKASRDVKQHFLGKYHDLSRRLAGEAGMEPEAVDGQTRSKRLPVFEDDRARLRLTPRHYAYLRIAEGCNQGCAFCTIPSIRGPMRSKPIERILAEARELAADGAIELNLIGQDTTSFGSDIGYEPGLAGLIRLLDRSLGDVAWLRLMYAYPSCFTDEMIGALAESPRFVKYIDMPLQHISNGVLSRMRRRVTRQQTEALLGKLRRAMPGITIRTTFIAGAPGESDADHRELLAFVSDFGFDMMGVFAYSAEPGTPMGRMAEQVPDAIKQQRLEALMLAQQRVAFGKARAAIGRDVRVLIDRAAGREIEDGYVARTAGQAPEIDSVTYVRSAEGQALHAGQMLDVRIVDSEGYDLVGELPRSPRRRSLAVLATGNVPGA
jgi:ribosomal protein S12 methylthiotransferase